MKRHVKSIKKTEGKPIINASQKKGYADAKYFVNKYAKAMKALAE